MSTGFQRLLEAAHYIEQQEKLKLSPQAAIPTILNDDSRLILHGGSNLDTAIANGGHHLLNGSNNNNNSTSVTNNNIINIRNSNIRHINGTAVHQVSSSAPAAAATFQHLNGHQHQQHSHASSGILSNGTTTTTSNGHQLHHHHQHRSLSTSSSSSSSSPSSTTSSTLSVSATAQHLNSSQLIIANHHDYEFNGNGVASPNGRSSEGRMSGKSYKFCNIFYVCFFH